MQRDFLKAFAQIGFMVGGGGLVLLLLEPRSSPAWVVSLCSTLIGGVLIVGVILVNYWRR